MSGVMQRCVPLSTGALSPDQRVNYQFGLVLGVDEFEQEDLYFRERDERASRTLHGYGTTVGLHVTAERPAVAPDDVEVKIAPGILVDQPGRPVVIPTAQCARVGAWLAAQERQALADEAPSPLAEHLSPSGDLTLYIVAEYSSCLDALVPLPGNPCGSDDEVTAASRVRDAWQLGFRWEPPSMPHWDGARSLADLLLPIELHDGSPPLSDEEALAEHIRAMAPGVPPPPVPLPAPPVLPRAGARAALDRLLTIWITEVRPRLAPDLIHPEGEAAVLLSTLTVVPAAPFDVDSPSIVAFQSPDDEGRPYLAPSQLIQELVLMGGGITTIVSGSPIEPPPPPPAPEPQKPVLQLATASPMLVRQELPGIELWFHVDKAADFDVERVSTLDEAVEILAECERDTTPVKIPYVLDNQPMPHNVFHLIPDADAWKELADQSPYLRVVIDLERLGLDGRGSAASYAEERKIVWSETQEQSEGGSVVVLWVRMTTGGEHG